VKIVGVGVGVGVYSYDVTYVDGSFELSASSRPEPEGFQNVGSCRGARTRE